MELGLTINGQYELLRAFARFPDVTARNVRVARKESGVLVVREARRTHRFQSNTGKLERAVKMVDDGAATTVFLNQSVTPYAAPIHDGSRPHVIRPKDKKVLRWATPGFSGPVMPGKKGRKSRSGFSFAMEVHHPGTKADPFLYEAAERMTPDVQARLQRGVDDSIRQAGLA